MTVKELLEELASILNQETEVKLIVGNELGKVIGVWTNSKPVIIEGEKRVHKG